MLDIIIFGKEVNYCINLTNYLCRRNDKIKIISIHNNVNDLLKFLQRQSASIILFNIDKVDYKRILESEIMKKYINSIILIQNNEIVNKKLQNKSNGFEDIYNLLVELIKKNNIKKTNFKRNIIIDKIEMELKYLNIQASYKGTKYLIEAIYILYNFKNYDEYNLERDIYSIISQKYHKSINNIKSNINYVINIIYLECREENLQKYIKEYKLYKFSAKNLVTSIVRKLKNNTIIIW